ncbi:MAG: S8 family peptidase [Anaerolineae bacterium]|jgi:serine protease AprX|nr:S8 family peptidase [Anaerolineae bacterium]
MSAHNKPLFSRLFLIVLVFVLSTANLSIASPPQQSYIIQGEEMAVVAAQVEAYGGVITSELEIIQGVAADLDPSKAAQLAQQPGIAFVSPNGRLQGGALPVVETSDAQTRRKTPSADAPEVVGADYIWEQGITGEGITIAIVDSGIANFAPLINDTGNQNRILAWKDLVQNKKDPVDRNGHGTHLASIMVNSAEGSDGSYNGIAPNANLVVVRVLDKNGYSDYETVIKGIDWVVKHRDAYQIKVLNLSLTGEVVAPYWMDPLNRAVTNAWAEGITVVTCAGNSGPDPMTVSVPGNNPYAITVGAFTDAYTPKDWTDDYLTSFSAAGPTQDAFIKPDLIAPGAHMLGMMGKNSTIAKEHEANQVEDSRYFEMAGTSQASAVVSGIVALMYEQNPDLTPDEVKYRLMITSMPMIEGNVDPEQAKANYSVFQQGAGRVNAPDAVFATEGVDGHANAGMDIRKDLADEEHYQGFAYYDEETATFGVTGVDNYEDGYSVWDGGYGIWSGGFGIWSGGFGIWSGGFGIWSGGFGIWSGNYGLWDEPILASSPTLMTMSLEQDQKNSLTPTGFDYLTLQSPNFSQYQLSIDPWIDE